MASEGNLVQLISDGKDDDCTSRSLDWKMVLKIQTSKISMRGEFKLKTLFPTGGRKASNAITHVSSDHSML